MAANSTATTPRKAKSKKEEALAFLDDLDNYEVVPSQNNLVGAGSNANSDSTRPITPLSSVPRRSAQYARPSTATSERRSSDVTKLSNSITPSTGLNASTAAESSEDPEAAQALAFLEQQINASKQRPAVVKPAVNSKPASASGASTPVNGPSGQATIGSILQPPSAPRKSMEASRSSTTASQFGTTPSDASSPAPSRWGISTSLWSTATSALQTATKLASEAQHTITTNATSVLESATDKATAAANQATQAASAARSAASSDSRLAELQALISSNRLNLKTLDLEKLRQEVMKKGTSALTELINTVAPPIGQGEKVRVWLGHEMKGYDGVEGVVYNAVAGIMEQTSSSELEVFFSSPTSASDQEEERSIKPVNGWDAASKRSEAGMKDLKERIKGDGRGGVPNPESPITTIPIYLYLQPVLIPSPYASSSSDKLDHLTFLISLSDPAHSLERTTISQAVPADWLTVEYDRSDWVEERLVDVLRVGVEVVVQEYVATRMGLKPYEATGHSSALPIRSYAKEAEIGVQAVLRACHLTKAVQETLTVDETVTKPDKSPVTVADLSAQSLISLHLLNFFPEDKIVGEEDTTELRANGPLREKVVGLVNGGFEKGRSENQGEWAEDKVWSEEEILSAIDAGSHVGGPKGRCWTIDPIDGTLGFLRKEQYAVCLALIVDGVVELGILACPNLGSESVGDESKGVLFLARKGEGSYSRSLLNNANYTKLSLPSTPNPPSSLQFLESVEAGHSAHSVQARIGEILGTREGNSIRMDSQAKYGCLGRGEGGAYLRIPTKYTGGKEYNEKIWDHASGSLLISESGGICTDMHGAPLDFSIGRTLSSNEGIVAAGRDMHAKVLEAVQTAVKEAQK